jgi:hypothetical protein
MMNDDRRHGEPLETGAQAYAMIAASSTPSRPARRAACFGPYADNRPGLG